MENTHKQVCLMFLSGGEGEVGKRQIPAGKKAFYGTTSLKFRSQTNHVSAYGLCNGHDGRE